MTALPVTSGVNAPTGHRNRSRSIASSGTPAAPTIVKSLRPATARADSRNDSVTLRFACWIAAIAATPTATPSTGRRARTGRRCAGPVTSARKTRRKAFIPLPIPSREGRGEGGGSAAPEPPVHDLHDAFRPARGGFRVGREDEGHP